MGKLWICNILCPCAHINVTTITDLLKVGCLLALYGPTVEPLNNGHIGGRILVLCWEVVSIAKLLASLTRLYYWGVRSLIGNLVQTHWMDKNQLIKGSNVLSRCYWVAICRNLDADLTQGFDLCFWRLYFVHSLALWGHACCLLSGDS